MIPLRRVTRPTVDVLEVLLASAEPLWGLRIITATGRQPGTVYPILERLESQGWLTSTWEEDASRPGPRRRFHVLTPDGRAAALDTCRELDRRSVAAARGRWVTP